MTVTLYGVNKKGQNYKAFVEPKDVDEYIKKGLTTEPPKEKEKEEVIEEKKNELKEVNMVQRKGRPKKEDKE